MEQVFRRSLHGYVGRFTLLHVLTYSFIGMLFYQVQGYEEAMAAIEVFEFYRPLESPLMAAAVFGGQILRGGILALLLYPFYNTFMQSRYGWLLLFLLLWGLTALGSAIFIPGLMEGIASAQSWSEFLSSMVVGVPEITVQMLVFSWLLFKWERRKTGKMMFGS